MLKWAEQTRKKLNTATENIEGLDNGNLDSLSLSSSISLTDLSGTKEKHSKLQHHRTTFARSRPLSLFVSPDEINVDFGDITDDEGKNSRCRPNASKSNGMSIPKSRRTSLPYFSRSFSTGTDSTQSYSCDESHHNSVNNNSKVTVKQELLKITTSNEHNKRGHSFWKNLINRSTWAHKPRSNGIYKSLSMSESDTHTHIEDPTSPISPIDNQKVMDNTSLKDMICSDPPMTHNVNRKESLKSIKRRNAIKKAKPFNKSATVPSGMRKSAARSPDSGYGDTRFSSSAADSTDDDDSEITSTHSSLSDFNFSISLKDLNEYIASIKIKSQT